MSNNEKIRYIGSYWPVEAVARMDEKRKPLYLSRSKYLLKIGLEHLQREEGKEGVQQKK